MPPYREPEIVPSSPIQSNLQIVYEDNHLIAVFKPHRVLTQGDETGDPSLMDLTKNYLKEKYQKPGNVFLGLVHRLDRPTAGIVLFAKTSKAASRLSEQFRTRKVRKVYRAVIEGTGQPDSDRLVQLLRWDGEKTVVCEGGEPGAQRAVLSYRTLRRAEKKSLIEIELETGRKHQIRAQFATIGFPVLGDRKYGARFPYMPGAVALVATELEVQHPTRQDETLHLKLPEAALASLPEFLS